MTMKSTIINKISFGISLRHLFTFLLLCSFTFICSAQRVTQSFHNAPLSDALLQLSRQSTDYTIFFLYNELEDFRVTTTVKNKLMPDAIQQMIGFYPIRMNVDETDRENKKIFVECIFKTDRHLTGTVLDEQGLPLPYANVAVLHPADSTVTYGGVSNESGYFAIPYDAETIIARISYVGYKTVYRRCGNPNLGTIRMQPDNYTLNKFNCRATHWS